MRSALFILALLPLLSFPAFAEEDTSCGASGGIVGAVKKGDETILMSCPEEITNNSSVPCTCHAPTAEPGKCRVYACNGNGQSQEELTTNPAAPVKYADLPLSADPVIAAIQKKAKADDAAKLEAERQSRQSPPPEPPKLSKEELKKQAAEKAAQEKLRKEEERKAKIEAEKQAKIDAAELASIIKKAEAHDREAESLLGFIYMRGNGEKPPGPLPDDERNAGEWREAPRPPPGVMLPQNFSKGEIWYKRAANKGDIDAQYNLGLLYRFGRGLHENREESFFWFSVLAKNRGMIGNMEMYLNDPGIPPDRIEVIKKRAEEWKPEPYSPAVK
ncbi:MAG: sel1 repeat family protein [Alphaproteobacteria bacterium]|nr:MAG: sel1 repeat family protein [Alphaproteobacteria bacterium]